MNTSKIPNKDKINISILLPAFNEEGNILQLLENIYDTLNKSKYKKNFEVIIINDGSKDKTKNIILEIINKYNNLRFIDLKLNYGKAYALDVGIGDSLGEIIVTMDSDLQYSAKNIITMINKLYEGYDLINGLRIKRQDSIFVKFFSFIYNIFLKYLFGLNTKDIFSGLKVYKKEIYDLIDYTGMARFIIFFCKKYNFNFTEIQIDHSSRRYGKTSYNFLDKIILSLKDIFSLVFCIYLGREKYYQLKQTINSIFLILAIYQFLKIFLFKSVVFSNLILLLIIFIIFDNIVSSFYSSKIKSNINFIKKQFIKK